MKKIELNEEEIDLLIFLLKKKVKGWEWAIENKKLTEEHAEPKIELADSIIDKLEG